MKTFLRALRPMGLALAALAGSGAPLPVQSQPLQVRDEPMHHVRLETARYRVYDVAVGQGETMQFHEHQADNVAIFLSDSEITNEFVNGQKADFSVKTGLASFASASPGKPYVHRVLLRGGAPFRNITIEFLSPPSSAPARDRSEPPDPALVLLRESPRGKAYRLGLEPAQTIKLPSGASEVFVVCLTDGTLTLTQSSKPDRHTKCDVGEFQLLDRSQTDSLKNDGGARVQLTLVAVD